MSILRDTGIAYGDWVRAIATGEVAGKKWIEDHEGKFLVTEDEEEKTYVIIEVDSDRIYVDRWKYEVEDVVSVIYRDCGSKKLYSTHKDRWLCPQCDLNG